MKKLIAFLIVLSVLLSLPMAAFAEDALSWTLNEKGVLTISGKGEMHDFVEDLPPWRKYDERIQELRVDYGVTNIGDQAFQSLVNLRAAYIPDSVKRIGEAAFYGCLNLRYVQLPAGLDEIGASVFGRGAKLQAVTLPEGLTLIGSEAFNCCTAMKEIYIPASVTEIEDSAFNACYGLKNIYFGGSQKEWENIRIGTANKPLSMAKVEFDADPADHIASDEVAFEDVPDELTWDMDSHGNLSISCSGRMPDYPASIPPWGWNREKVKKITVEASHIGSQAFQYCKKARTVELNYGLESIGDAAFYHCEALQDVKLPESVQSIGAQAFDGCFKLRSIQIPDGVTVIPDAVFNECKALESVYIPASVTEIGQNAFNGCGSLKNVYFGGTAAEWDAIKIGGQNTQLTKANIRTDVADGGVASEIPDGVIGGVVGGKA